MKSVFVSWSLLLFSEHLSGAENRCFPDGDEDNKAVLELRFSWPGCTRCTNQPTNVFLSVVNLPFFLCEWAKWDLVERMLAARHRLSVEAHLQPGLTLLTVNGFMVLSFTLQHSLRGVIGDLVSTKWQFIGKSALFVVLPSCGQTTHLHWLYRLPAYLFLIEVSH